MVNKKVLAERVTAIEYPVRLRLHRDANIKMITNRYSSSNFNSNTENPSKVGTKY